MLDMSWGELMVIGGVALIVIGPKDLPKALRTVGQMTTKVRRLASEFQSQFNDAMREAELDDVRKEVEGINRQVSSVTATTFNPLRTIRDELKNTIERPSSAAASTSADPVTTADVPPASGSVMEEAGPVHHIEPAEPKALDVPVPPPAIPAMPRELTGPGLEPAIETAPAKGSQA